MHKVLQNILGDKYSRNKEIVELWQCKKCGNKQDIWIGKCEKCGNTSFKVID